METKSVKFRIWVTQHGVKCLARGDSPEAGMLHGISADLDMTNQGWLPAMDIEVPTANFPFRKTCVQATLDLLDEKEREERAGFEMKMRELDKMRSEILALPFNGVEDQS